MKKIIKNLQPALLLTAILSALFLSGCATQIKPAATMNPPPAEPFSAFNRFEMTDITLAPAYANSDPNKKALVRIQESVNATMQPVLKSWNFVGSQQTAAPRTLVITPVITEIKFIGGAARFWAGAMAGSSAAITKLTITEKETGKVIATPEVYAVGNAWAGGWTIGATDNAMLTTIANRITDYMIKNYTEAVGGPTGADAK